MKLTIETSCWVDKYKPKHSSDIKGQSKNITRLKKWLETFDASSSKPVMIHGPPGIGKTTAAHLCCKETGYKTIEMNASDQRNKRIVEDIVRSMTNNSRLNFFGKASETKDALIIDEVDGMAGNEDRGGIAQLIQEIKRTKKPIIFICNDGQSLKIKTLINYCEYPPIAFRRPEIEDVRGVVSKIAAIENIKIDNKTIDELIESSNRDIRQVVNFLSLFKQTNKQQDFNIKTTRLNPFEAARKALCGLENFESRTECFFSDYNILPLFIFENYLKQQPRVPKKASVKSNNPQIKLLRSVSKAANSICFGDLIEKQIRSTQSWSLLPMHAIFSTSLPTTYMNSNQVGRVDFPQFLGKLSNSNKRMRMQGELNAHMCLKVRGGLSVDYYDLMKDRLTLPLIKNGADGVEEVITFMEEYNLMREDFDNIMELATWSFADVPKIDSKAKAALTRQYKKANITLPYNTDLGLAKKRKFVIPAFEGDEEGGDEAEEEEDKDDELPAPVKKPASKAVPAKKPSVSKATTAKRAKK